MRASKLQNKDRLELAEELSVLLKMQFSLRMQLATQQLSNVSQLKKARRQIARIKTIMHQRELER